MEIKIHPLFILLMALAAATGYFIELITMFCLVVMHELGHVFAARGFRWRVRRIELLPFGGVAEVDEWGNKPPREEIAVALAGPLVNLVMILVSGLLRMVHVWDSQWTIFFMQGNAIMAGLNLLPVWPLDGGKIMQSLLSYRIAYLKTISITTIVSLSLSNFFLIYGLLREPPHVNLVVLTMYIIVSNVTAHRRRHFQFMRFLLSKYKAPEEARKEIVVIDGGMKVKDVVKMLKKGSVLCFRIEGIDRLIGEDELLAAYFEKKRMQWAVADVFSV